MMLFLGIDIGTTGAKVILMDEVGKIVGSATRQYPLFSPRPLWSEQNPEDWWDAVVAAIRNVNADLQKGEIAAIGLTGQMHGLVALDGKGRVIRPCILWNDQRTGEQCERITRRIGSDRIVDLTGNPVLTGFTAPKILWMKENEPELYRRIRNVLLPKDYIRYRLSGAFFTDVSDASGTSLFDVRRRIWSPEMLSGLDIPEQWLPESTESPFVSSTLTKDAARQTGLEAGIPIVGGAGDQAAQAIGTGIVHEGSVAITIGTSGVVFAASREYRVTREGLLHAYCHAVPGMWHLMGVMLSAGGSLRWYRDVFCAEEKQLALEEGRDPYDVMTEHAAGIEAGSDGILFLPYLSGERSPHPDPLARGLFFGLTLRHTKAHLTRAVLEGISFGLSDSLHLMRESGVEPDAVYLSGGGAKSGFWRQLLSDICGLSVRTVSTEEGASYGAALLAAVGSGLFTEPAEAVRKVVRVSGETEPGPDTDRYKKIYQRYRRLYPAVRKEFRYYSTRIGFHG